MTNRKPIIAGNWKMNNTKENAEKLLKELIPLVADATAEVVVCVPYTAIETAVKLTKGTNIAVGSQNVSWADSGAFTGEISADMLLELGAKYAIIGHSERRTMFGETDETVNKRTKQAIAKGLIAIVCIGETLAERQGGITESVLKTQILGGLKDIPASDFDKIVIAYEPVWAIGTGLVATDEQAEAAVAYTRRELAALIGKKANEVCIQYGGSMNASNVDGLMAQPNIDGGLIGGASLKAVDFARVVKFSA
ncbi:MAG: triose-phosphate isomerase [Firmicutes bacterium]|nr:triose-phosphate isomerase [Bacillota bacterium]